MVETNDIVRKKDGIRIYRVIGSANQDVKLETGEWINREELIVVKRGLRILQNDFDID